MEEGVDEAPHTAEEDQRNADDMNIDIQIAEYQNLQDTSSEQSIALNEIQTELKVHNVEKSKEVKQEQNPEEKLCGWLNLRSRGIGNIKTSRNRYFLYCEENCKLYIYRDPNDLVPLGEICIATASFYFDPSQSDKPGLFQIKSDGKEYNLDAGNRHDMYMWFQALQHKRREFNIAKSLAVSDEVGHWTKKRASKFSGLLSADILESDKINSKEDNSGIEPLPEIHITVPENFTAGPSTPSATSQKTSSGRGFNSLKTDIQQAILNIKKPGKTQRETNSPKDIEHLDNIDKMSSTSTTSINSIDSNASDIKVRSQISSDKTVTNYKNRASSFETNTGRSNPFDAEFQRHRAYTVENGSLLDIRPITNNMSTKGSWDLINQQEIPPPDAKEVIDQKGLQRVESNSKFYTDIEESEENEKPLTSSGEGKKGSNLVSTLKRIRIGKRQISEQVMSAKVLPKVSLPKWKSSEEPQLPSNTGHHGNSEVVKKVQDLEEELTAHKEIIALLQDKLSSMVKEETSRQELISLPEDDKNTIIVEKDRHIIDLEQQLADIKQENKTLHSHLETSNSELQETSDQVNMFKEMLKVKDQIIMEMTHQLNDQETQSQGSGSFDQDPLHTSLSRDSMSSLRSEKSVDEKEMERLRDMCQGYELQHKFLTKEILEMNELRKLDEARENKLSLKLATTKAQYCQIKSKYFVLLKQQKEQAPHREGADEQEVVNQLLQDALETEVDVDLQLTGSGQEYDRYGFSKKHYLDEFEDHNEDDPLQNKAEELERQSKEISTKVRENDQDTSLRVKWENYMVGKESNLQKSSELKSLIRQGIPHDYRTLVWKGCINMHVGNLREQRGPGFYQSLLQAKATATSLDPSIKQIELDLLRTLPNNKHYESIDSEGVLKLRKVLLAFSEYNRLIGYCQGLNRLAAIALLFLSEEDAFWCLVAIVEYILPPEYFSTTLMAAQADQRVLKDLVADKLPKVHQALEHHGVDLSLFTFNWFLTVFVDGVPTETFLRIWDTFLYEGSKVLFRFAIAFLKIVEPEILQQRDSLQLNRYLRRVGDKMTNIKQIAFYAFSWINPFPMGKVASRRQQHLVDIKQELKELEELRHGMRVNREAAQNQYDMSDDDLDS